MSVFALVDSRPIEHTRRFAGGCDYVCRFFVLCNMLVGNTSEYGLSLAGVSEIQ